MSENPFLPPEHSFLPPGYGSQRCPDCDEPITSEVINIKERVALCAGCGKLSRLSALNTSGRSIGEMLSRPPWGCSIVSDGQRLTATASMRSLSRFLRYAALALLANSMTSLFGLIMIGHCYTSFVGPLPNWFPSTLNNGKQGMNGHRVDIEMLVFLCIFLYIFVFLGIWMVAAAVLNLLGKVEVIIDEFDSYVVTSVPFLKWKKRFDQGEVKAVEFGDEVFFVESEKDIKIIADRSVKFGLFLQSDRREWLRAALREVFFAKAPEWRLSNVSAPHWLSRNPPQGRPEAGVGADSRQRPAAW